MLEYLFYRKCIGLCPLLHNLCMYVFLYMHVYMYAHYTILYVYVCYIDNVCAYVRLTGNVCMHVSFVKIYVCITIWSIFHVNVRSTHYVLYVCTSVTPISFALCCVYVRFHHNAFVFFFLYTHMHYRNVYLNVHTSTIFKCTSYHDFTSMIIRTNIFRQLIQHKTWNPTI